ncbi:putative transcription factor Hap3/NF-YB family [Medicago truncatula]|uniref:Ccaat-box-binding factor HAP3-like protein n=1 Tax=Medicago truncatula TaxID=3880 RepID=G7ICG4_MEDTR|nr:nuclear transcription factor Y subunit B-4 [Medicago truncatula]AES60017.1 ccaat-box-binding factor HAP3-like protein [Medicago truncatula]AFK49660.1 nuclear trancription factor Y subunit B10 [Medicago truncatula]RHN78396.1 putative transcription factor Hap3/NF-YB family [Medicago truncatula]
MAGIREQDQYMPIANVIRIMRRILPSHAKISDDAKETIQECVSEYISFITSEANDRCQREQRKTVTAEDILWAMGKLGFDDYVHPLTFYLQRYRESEGEPASVRRTSSLALPPSFPLMQQHSSSFSSMPLPLINNNNHNSNGYGHGYGFDFDQGFYRDGGDDAAPSSASFVPNFDCNFLHLKRDNHNNNM